MRPFLRISKTEDHVVIKEQTVKLEAPFTGLCEELFYSHFYYSFLIKIGSKKVKCLDGFNSNVMTL